VKPDTALDLVVAYLRVNDYFVVTELELHEETPHGFRTLTDVDVLAVRFPSAPGTAHYHGGEGAVECLLAGNVDPALGAATDRCDVIIGEVKRGEAAFNPALRDPRVLHAVLRRLGDAARAPLDHVVDQLARRGRTLTPAAQIRLVAFGAHGSVANGVVVRHDYMVDWLNAVLAEHHTLFEITGFSDPVMSLLSFAAHIGRSFAPRPEQEENKGA
jgi:hypothetical protein